MATGNLTMRPDSVVHSIIYDEEKKKATGVRVIDAHTQETTEYFARIIFVNASCLNSNLILLNSTSRRFPHGLGNDHDILGRYIIFQNYRGMITADIDGPTDKYYYGRRPLEMLIPSFRNLRKQEMDFQRGYISFWGAGRNRANAEGIGGEYKDAISEAGDWSAYMSMQGEVVPDAKNHVRLHPELKDPWGIPQLITSVGYSENDERMLKDFFQQGAEMLEISGCKNITTRDLKWSPGLDIHEMGGCRMGKDPKSSMLNGNNQLHACPNVFVTDGACMDSTGNQNPSLTYMALTARAANIAVDQLKKGEL
jgi:choline dehydrogenase-like flavoprotein